MRGVLSIIVAHAQYWRRPDITRNIKTITGAVRQKISIHSHKNDEKVWNTIDNDNVIELSQFTEKPTLVTIDFPNHHPNYKSQYFSILVDGKMVTCVFTNVVNVLDNTCNARRSVVISDTSSTFRHTLNYPIEISIVLEVNQLVSATGYFVADLQNAIDVFHIISISNRLDSKML